MEKQGLFLVQLHSLTWGFTPVQKCRGEGAGNTDFGGFFLHFNCIVESAERPAEALPRLPWSQAVITASQCVPQPAGAKPGIAWNRHSPGLRVRPRVKCLPGRTRK